MFQSTGSYEPWRGSRTASVYLLMFQSTGSYEPWRRLTVRLIQTICFNPRALTSPDVSHNRREFSYRSFNPRALTSPDGIYKMTVQEIIVSIHGLLRALTRTRFTSVTDLKFQSTGSYEPWQRGWKCYGWWCVSIHGLLRALTAISNKLFAKNCRIFYIIHNSNHNRK